MKIQPRDEKILRLCYEHQFLIYEHIRYFFPNEREARRRVRELESAQWIRREFHPVFGFQSMIRLTKNGCQWVSIRSPLLPPKAVNADTLIHDSIVVSVRLRLSQIWSAEFVSERALKAKDYHSIPDGIFFFPSGKGIAIEVENSDKGRTRFLKVVERWRETPAIAFVLYVATNPRLFTSVKSYLKASSLPTIGVVLWSELKTGTPPVFTQCGTLDLLKRKDF